MFRRLFWLSVFVGVGYMIWRWAQKQSEATTPARTAQLFTPATGTPSPAAETPSPAPPTGRRPIPTRVHRGAPPPAPRPAGTPAVPFGDAPATAEPAAHASAMDEADAQPAPAEAEPAPLDTAEAPSIQTLVAPAGDAPLTNINTADEAALIALPGIGPALARRIIAYREANGPFATIDQLEVIQGIGHRNMSEFRHLVTV